MTSAPTRPILRYHGGKWRLAPWVIGHFPLHRIYVEPYGGAASILLRKPRCYAEVYNDVWDDVVNLFRVLRDERRAILLEAQLRLTPFARTEFRLAYLPTQHPVERARRLLIRSFMGYGSASANPAHKTGFRNDSDRSGTTPARDWRNWPDNIQSLTERLQGVCIENRPAMQIIPEFDTPKTLFYVDPPYPHSTRCYRSRNEGYCHEMTDAEHIALAELLHQVQGMVVVSGYACPLYLDAYRDFVREERGTYADGAKPRTECLWLNPAAVRNRQKGLDL